MKFLELIKIQVIELYVLDLTIMDIMQKHVKKHAKNIHILLYKMVMEKQVGVVVKMNYLM